MGKIYARVFQACFKVGMAVLPWRIPETLEGPDCIKKLPARIKKDGFHKVLVVTDAVLMKLGALNGLFAAMDEAGIAYTIYDKAEPNPTDIHVNNGVDLYKASGCECMIAFGGGSPMDCAKGIGARLARPNKTVAQLQGTFKVLHKLPMFYAVPTTAGTGSETTLAAVITDSATSHKAAIQDTSLMPIFAVLDPLLTVGLPPKVTSTTGMDALCHAVEAYTNHTYNSKLENKLAEDAVRLVYHNLYQAYLDGNDLEARQNMQKAAFYAGRAFTRGCVGYVHAIGHTLGGLYGTPHGLAMSINLPHVMRLFGSAAHERLARLAEVCGMTGKDDAEKAEKFISWIEELKEKMDIPQYIDPIPEKDEDQIIRWAMKEGNPIYPTPVYWGYTEFKKALRYCQGKDV